MALREQQSPMQNEGQTLASHCVPKIAQNVPDTQNTRIKHRIIGRKHGGKLHNYEFIHDSLIPENVNNREST